MKFRVSKASDWDYKEEIEIINLEELIDFMENTDDVIIGTNTETSIDKETGMVVFGEKYYFLKIYDTYIE